MTDNPFEALGGGGFDMNALLQQAQQMQQQLEQAQARLHDAEVQGSVAGGAVSVTLNGVGELTKVDLDADALADSDLADVGDLVVAAFRDAKAKADALAGDALGPLAGGLGGLGGAPAPGGQLGFGGAGGTGTPES